MNPVTITIHTVPMLHCFTGISMVCKLDLFCKYNCIVWWLCLHIAFWLTGGSLYSSLCFGYTYTRLAILAIVCPVPCTNCYKKKIKHNTYYAWLFGAWVLSSLTVTIHTVPTKLFSVSVTLQSETDYKLIATLKISVETNVHLIISTSLFKLSNQLPYLMSTAMQNHGVRSEFKPGLLQNPLVTAQ